MDNHVRKFYEFLDRPIFPWGRAVVAALVVFLALSFSAPLWRISLVAPQYPDGLHIDIYSYTVEGGNRGQDIQEINTLNHYIGMHRIDRALLSDLDWMPFAFGVLGLVTLRAAALGKVSTLVDVNVMTFYLFVFSLVRFYYRLYVYGHDLAKDAPMRVDPFTPTLLGSKQVANFTIDSWPRAGTAFMALFALGMVGVLVWHLAAGRREAVRAGRSG